MPDDAPPPVPQALAVGDRVIIEGEVRQLGKEGHLVTFESGYGVRQYVWVKFRYITKAPPLAPS
jgi:hypothetical protein